MVDADIRATAKKEFRYVRDVLFNDWDPLSVGDNSNLADEYDSYVGRVIEVAKATRDVEAVAACLGKIEEQEMGLGEGQQTPGREIAAKKIVQMLTARS